MADPIARARYAETCALSDLAPPEALFDRLIAEHTDPDRFYHTIDHVLECLALAREVRAQLEDPAAVEWAFWFHDAIYDSRRGDNEAQSARLARRLLGEVLAEERVLSIESLILATCHREAPPTSDARFVVDLDLAILGAEPVRFAEYERQIGEEYAWVPREEYARGRRAVLEGFLARERIYSTPQFRERFEESARENLRRALAEL